MNNKDRNVLYPGTDLTPRHASIIFRGMIRYLAWCAMLVLVLPLCSRRERRDDIAVYMAGIFVLRSIDHLTPAEKRVRYEELKKLSGFGKANMTHVIDRYRDDPREWQEVLKETREILIRYNDSISS